MTEYTPKLLNRFWKKVDIHPDPNSCWNWTARKSRGYGYIKINNKHVGAHRISYELEYGTFPHELDVLHTCDNPSCVNPRHLFLGTHQENMQGKVRKDRQARGEINGKLTDYEVAEIRQMYAKGGTSYRQLASKFCVSHTQIRHIVSYMSRKVDTNS